MTDTSTNSIHLFIEQDDTGKYVFTGSYAALLKRDLADIIANLVTALNTKKDEIAAAAVTDEQNKARIADLTKADSRRQFGEYVNDLCVSLGEYGGWLTSFEAGDGTDTGSFTFDVHNVELSHDGHGYVRAYSPLLRRFKLDVNFDGTLPLRSLSLLETLISHNSLLALLAAYQEMLAAKDQLAAEAKFLKIYSQAALSFARYYNEPSTKDDFVGALIRLQLRDPDAFGVYEHDFNYSTSSYRPTIPQTSLPLDTRLGAESERREAEKRRRISAFASAIENTIHPLQEMVADRTKDMGLINFRLHEDNSFGGTVDPGVYDSFMKGYRSQDPEGEPFLHDPKIFRHRPITDFPNTKKIELPVTADRTPDFPKRHIGREITSEEESGS